jgi:hypothetical protein
MFPLNVDQKRHCGGILIDHHVLDGHVESLGGGMGGRRECQETVVIGRCAGVGNGDNDIRRNDIRKAFRIEGLSIGPIDEFGSDFCELCSIHVDFPYIEKVIVNGLNRRGINLRS